MIKVFNHMICEDFQGWTSNGCKIIRASVGMGLLNVKLANGLWVVPRW